MTAEERNTALLNLLAKVQARHHRANRRWREARFPDCDLDLERDAARARLEYLTDFLSHRFNNPAGRNPDTITMNTPRLLHLERQFAAGAPLSQAEIRELEELRDLAGQASLPIADERLSPVALTQAEKERQREGRRQMMAAQIAAPLRGRDGGEQPDLFGGAGLLF